MTTPSRKRPWILWALVLSSFLALLALLAFLTAQSNARAIEQAAALCSSVEPGTPADSVVEAALNAGASLPNNPWTSDADNSDVLMARFTGLNKMMGAICIVTAVEGAVVSSELAVFDL